MLAMVVDRTPDGETRNGLVTARELPFGVTVEEAVDALGNGSRITSPDTVPFALWCAALTWPRYAGRLFGLSIFASPPFAVLGLIWWRIKDIERVIIPAAATALILLILPVSHAGPPPATDRRPDFQREMNRRNAARGGGFQPPVFAPK